MRRRRSTSAHKEKSWGIRACWCPFAICTLQGSRFRDGCVATAISGRSLSVRRVKTLPIPPASNAGRTTSSRNVQRSADLYPFGTSAHTQTRPSPMITPRQKDPAPPGRFLLPCGAFAHLSVPSSLVLKTPLCESRNAYSFCQGVFLGTNVLKSRKRTRVSKCLIERRLNSFASLSLSAAISSSMS